MYTKFHLAILERLFNLRCIGGKHTSKENALRGLKNVGRDAKNAYDDLRKWNIIIIKPTSYQEQVSLNPQHIDDVEQLLNPNLSAIVKDKPPIENSLNSEYDRVPFHISFGDKPIKGSRAKYSYHKKITDPNKFIVYIIVDGEKKGIINLGSFADKESLLSRAIIRIDEKFKGQPFMKSHMYGLGKDIEGNRQQPKAIVDMLIFYGYVIKRGEKYYQRTNKNLPISGLDGYTPEPVLDSINKIKDQPKS